MRLASILVAAALFVTPTPSFADATSAIDAAERPARHPMISGIVRALKQSAGGTDAQRTAAWVSELTGYYQADDVAPLWVDSRGLTAKGAVVVAEIRAADRYGLDPEEFRLPDTASASPEEIEATLSLAAVTYVWHARGGRIDPSELSLWLDQRPGTIYASTAIRQVGEAGDPVVALRAQHPRHVQFEALRQALLMARGLVEQPKAAPLTSGSTIKAGERHIDVALVRRRLGVSADEGNETLADDEVLSAVRAFMRKAGSGKKKWVIDDEVRNALNAADTAKSPADNKALIENILVNMERWRWVPDDFGALHVWNNIPEYESRIVKDGKVILRERIIVGKADTQTPVFSDSMSQIVFQPTWGLPPSIKLRQFGNRGDITGLLASRNMRIVDDDGTVIRPSRINWGKVDIRNVPIVQGPGSGNPLGRLKFVFPNAHDVYMHDTPDKHLFSASARTFTHGCMRLRNPQQYAEVILRERNGWTPADVAKTLTYTDTIKVPLSRNVPVHVTYFTAVVDEGGRLMLFDDIYGHDKRIADAFRGVPIPQIAARDPALAQLRENQELARRSGNRVSKRWGQQLVTAAQRGSASRQGFTQSNPKPFASLFD